MGKILMPILGGILGTFFFVGTALALPIVNGDFSGGLSGWETDGDATINNAGQVVLRTPGYDSYRQDHSPFPVASLFQDVTFDNSILNFDFIFSNEAEAVGNGFYGFYDSFEVFFMGMDPFYDVLLLDLEFDAQGDIVVWEDQGASLIGGTYSVDLSSLNNLAGDPINIVGQTGTLFLDLFDEDDGYRSTVILDNITNPVPEPATIALIGTGFFSLVSIRWRRRRS